MAANGSSTHVVVLAAGKGSRLGAFSEDSSKWLLPVGGMTIAERQLGAIEDARRALGGAIESVRVVTGHAAGEIERFLEDRTENVGTLFNPDFAGLNNWRSVLVALEEIGADPGGRVVIVNGDLFVKPGWITDFLIAGATTEAESLIGLDFERELTDESMKVSVNPGEPRTLRKIGKVEVEEPVAEYVGLLMARGAVLEAFRERLEGFTGRPESADEWYERAVGISAADGVSWTAWPTPDSLWVEIDDDGDHRAATRIAGGG